MPRCSETERPTGIYHLLFVLDVSLYSVKLFPKQSTRFKVKDTFISSTVEEISTHLNKQALRYINQCTFFSLHLILAFSMQALWINYLYHYFYLTVVYYFIKAFQNTIKKTKKKMHTGRQNKPVKANWKHDHASEFHAYLKITKNVRNKMEYSLAYSLTYTINTPRFRLTSVYI